MISYRGHERGNSRPQASKPPHQPPQGPPPTGLPAGYPGEYFDSKGNIKGEIITSTAEEVAKILGNARFGSKTLAYGQFRKFYAQAMVVKSGLEAGQDFLSLRPKLLSLIPLTANAVGAGNAPLVLKQFIEANVTVAQRDEKHFKAFITHFQSVIEYFKYHFPRG